jgi:cystathionine beta-synthase
VIKSEEGHVEVVGSYEQTIGNTPLVALPRLTAGCNAKVLAKMEQLNPGGSAKDRIALHLIEAAERTGRLCAGGTIVEATSGNTGIALAIVAAIKGYRLVCVVPDKVSLEKRSLLRAYGAEVIVCPTAAAKDSPDSYYSVADRVASEIPHGYRPDQYSNPANPAAHYASTGPEVWRQTHGRVTHFVAGVGTGGTITGVGRYLKEQNPDVTIVGVDPEGSIYTRPDDVHTYLTEGIGEDFWPSTLDASIVDRWFTIGDRESFAVARQIARLEGVLVGPSSGTAMAAALRLDAELPDDAVVVVLFADSGRNYVSKLFDERWLRDHDLVASDGE